MQIPAWTDRRSRPLGAIVNLDRYQPDAAERAAALRDQIERLSDVLHRTRTTLGEMRARIATMEAAGHAAEVTGQEPSGDVNALTVTYLPLAVLARQIVNGNSRSDVVPIPEFIDDEPQLSSPPI